MPLSPPRDECHGVMPGQVRLKKYVRHDQILSGGTPWIRSRNQFTHAEWYCGRASAFLIAHAEVYGPGMQSTSAVESVFSAIVPSSVVKCRSTGSRIQKEIPYQRWWGRSGRIYVLQLDPPKRQGFRSE
jgi:hypothetical protein